MRFRACWTVEAERAYGRLARAAESASRQGSRAGRTKSSKAEGLFNQVVKCISLLLANPRHPGLKTHEYSSMRNPFDPKGRVFEAYAQNRTPCAYRVFWCYGPERGEITIIAITPHP